MTTLCFRIDGQPYAQKRHRSTKSGRTYNPPENVQFKRTAQAVMKTALHIHHLKAPFAPKGQAVRVDAMFTFKRTKDLKDPERSYKVKKPDLDNLLKAILDAGSDILWHDDAQVVSIGAVKFICGESDKPQTQITVYSPY